MNAHSCDSVRTRITSVHLLESLADQLQRLAEPLFEGVSGSGKGEPTSASGTARVRYRRRHAPRPRRIGLAGCAIPSEVSAQRAFDRRLTGADVRVLGIDHKARWGADKGCIEWELDH